MLFNIPIIALYMFIIKQNVIQDMYEILKQARKDKGMTQAKIAAISGLTITTVSLFENGSAQTIRNLEKYAGALGLRVVIEGLAVKPEVPPAYIDEFEEALHDTPKQEEERPPLDLSRYTASPSPTPAPAESPKDGEDEFPF